MDTAARVDRLEDALVRLAVAQERTEAQLEQLVEGQRALVAAQERTEGRLEELAAGQAALVAAQERTEGRLEQLAQAQERTEGRLEQLAQAQERTGGQIAQLVSSQRVMAGQLAGLLSWQVGEDGRRRGERLERSTAKGANSIFQGGMGGSTDWEWVQRWLNEVTAPLVQSGTYPSDAIDNPALADVIRRKADTVVVVEVSNAVDGYDVERANRRAQTLRRAGLNAVPAVIGNSWTDGAVRSLADEYGLAWLVTGEISESLIAIRKLVVTVSN